MTEVGMNDYDIDPDVFRAHVRDAQRMRAEALLELLMAAGKGTVRLGASLGAFLSASLGQLVGALRRRRKWNLSVPAPHR
jgi:hypothetical protein